jgi:hypothetical protein
MLDALRKGGAAQLDCDKRTAGRDICKRIYAKLDADE